MSGLVEPLGEVVLREELRGGSTRFSEEGRGLPLHHGGDQDRRGAVSVPSHGGSLESDHHGVLPSTFHGEVVYAVMYSVGNSLGKWWFCIGVL